LSPLLKTKRLSVSANYLYQQGGISMKKTLLADGAGFLRFCAVLAALGTSPFFAPPSFAQATHYDLSFIGLPEGSVNITMYIGLDRKLKADVPGQLIRITVTPPLTQPKRVRLSLSASAQGSSVIQCNGQIATAITVLDLSGAGRDLGTSAFTGGSGGIAVIGASTNQPCIDALADKMTSGVASLPTGIYRIDAVLNDAITGAPLATGSHTIRIEGASTNEAVINLTSPQNGEYVPSTGSVVFNFDTSIPGRLLAFEHSSSTQSQDDATRDLNSPLKMLDLPVTSRGSNQITAAYPGVALRGWNAGRKYSWLFLGSVSGSTDVRRSAVWSFTIAPNDPVLARLAMTLASAPDPIGSTFNNLISSGYTLAFSGSNPILLQEGDNGIPRAIDISQLLSWLADLARRNVQVNAVVTQ
jgi:hypothetical protein